LYLLDQFLAVWKADSCYVPQLHSKFFFSNGKRVASAVAMLLKFPTC
jgi:hypothetical protein